MSTLATNIERRLKLLKMNQHDLSVKSGVSQATIHRLLKGKYTKSKRIPDLADALECPVDWLMHGSQGLNVDAEDVRRTPLISWVSACDWNFKEEHFKENAIKKWVEHGARTGEESFALRVYGSSMHNPSGSPCVPKGSIIIIDPDIIAKSEDIILVKLDTSANVTLRQLIIDYPDKYLKPLNTEYKTIEMDQGCKIIGVVKQVILDL